MPRTSKLHLNHKSIANLKRKLCLECLESRQLLSANPVSAVASDLESDAVCMAELEPQSKYVVNISEDVIADVYNYEDDEASLREVLQQIEDDRAENAVVRFADGLDSIQLDASLDGLDGLDGVTIYGGDDGISIEIAEDVDISISNLDFYGVSIANDEQNSSVTITDCTFAGKITDTGVLINSGTMILNTVEISEVILNKDYTQTQTQAQERAYNRGIDVELPDTLELALVYNNGTLEATDLKLLENTGIATTDRVDCNMTFAGVLNDYAGTMTLTSVTIGENYAEANSTRGDVSATFYGIENFGTAEHLNNLMIFANTADSPNQGRFKVSTSKEVYAIFTSVADLTLYNGTILQGMDTYRADIYVANTIYLANENSTERGFIKALTSEGIVAPNLAVTDLSEIAANYAGFKVETGSFKDEEGNYNFHLNIDSAVKDKGNNAFVSDDATIWSRKSIINEDSSVKEIAIDLLGNSRIVKENGNVDLGAVECAIEELIVENLTGTPADGEDGLSTVIFTWDANPNAESYEVVCNGNTYKVAYENGTYKVTPITEGVIYEYNDDTYVVPTIIIDGLDPKTTVQATVTAIADKSGDWLDSEAVTAEATTKSRLDTPILSASLGDTRQINLRWIHNKNNTNITGYEIQYIDSDTEKLETIEIPFEELKSIMSVTLDSDKLSYDTDYNFQIKAIAASDNTQYADSEWGNKEATTGVQLEAPVLNEGYTVSEDFSKVTISWTDDNEANTVYTYEVNYYIEGNEGDLITKPTKDKSIVISGLEYGETYIFYVVAKGNSGTSEATRTCENRRSDSSEASNEISVVISNIVLNVNAQGISDKEIKVTWDAIEGANNYVVTLYDESGEQVGDAQEFSSEDEKNKFSCTFGPDDYILTPKTTYTVQIEAQDENSKEIISKDVEATTWDKLETPKLTATTSTVNSITVAWESVEGASSYVVQCRTSEDGEWTTLDNDGSSATWDEELDVDPSVTVWFNIQAISVSENLVSSDVSRAFEFKTKARLTIDAENLTAEVTSDSTINVKWEPVDGATGYELRYIASDSSDSTDLSKWNKIDVDKDATSQEVIISQEITGLDAYTDYDIQLTALGDETIETSNPVIKENVKTMFKLAPPTIDASSVKCSANEISGKLNAVENGEVYALWYSEGETFNEYDCTQVAVNDDLTFKAPGLEPLKTYSFRTLAVGNYNNEAEVPTANSEYGEKTEGDTNTWSWTTTEKSRLATPDVSADYDSEENQIDIEWDDVENAEGYTIQYKTENEEWSNPEQVSDTSWSLMNPTAEAIYTFKVVAIGDDNYDDSDAGEATCTLPATITLTPVILKEASTEMTREEIPTGETWVDEWTDVYMEVWTADTAKLAEGRQFIFTPAIPEGYDIESLEVNEDVISMEKNDNGSYTITVEETMSGDDATLMARFYLTVNQGNIVSWKNPIMEGAFSITGLENVTGATSETQIYAVPGDMDDNGTIDFTANGGDWIAFQEEYDNYQNKPGYESYADFNSNGVLDIADDNSDVGLNDSRNGGKSWYDDNLDIWYPAGFSYHKVTNAPNPTGSVKAAALEVEPVEATVTFVDGNPSYEITQGTADDYLAETPVENDNNSMSGNGKENEPVPFAAGEDFYSNKEKQ